MNYRTSVESWINAVPLFINTVTSIQDYEIKGG